MPSPSPQMISDLKPRSPDKVARCWQQNRKSKGRDKAKCPHRPQCDMPAKKIGQEPDHDTATQPANRRPADVNSHRHAKALGINFLSQIGHGNRWHPAQHQSFKGAHHQKGMPVRKQRRNQVKHGRHTHRHKHQFLAPCRLRYRARQQNGKG